MAQSYEKVRRQAKEYELQLQEIKAREIDQEIEDFKESEEYNEFNKFFETYDPEKYRIATALFLDLVFVKGVVTFRRRQKRVVRRLRRLATKMTVIVCAGHLRGGMAIGKQARVELTGPKQRQQTEAAV